jgi:GNAT superfamily N-acetyltransferase
MAASIQVAAPIIALAVAGPTVRPFVRDSWLRSQWAADMRGKMLRGDFFREQGERIDRLLPRSSIITALLPSVPDEVLGYVVLQVSRDDPICHWCYVKHAYRRLGIATQLARAACRMGTGQPLYSHKGDARGKKLAMRFGAKFNPYREV